MRSGNRRTLLSRIRMGSRCKRDRCTIRCSLPHRYLVAFYRPCCLGGSDRVLVSRGRRDH
ncbi:hypothetical protein FOCG_18503 [Fusarium oxysporum f. sp. radicis-lycopersici 26381]|nr:hypothetical protein FOCG_18503 [Fusarium oxysporum f. sp. radicis-lycopersici 26381]